MNNEVEWDSSLTSHSRNSPENCVYSIDDGRIRSVHYSALLYIFARTMET